MKIVEGVLASDMLVGRMVRRFCREPVGMRFGMLVVRPRYALYPRSGPEEVGCALASSPMQVGERAACCSSWSVQLVSVH